MKLLFCHYKSDIKCAVSAVFVSVLSIFDQFSCSIFISHNSVSVPVTFIHDCKLLDPWQRPVSAQQIRRRCEDKIKNFTWRKLTKFVAQIWFFYLHAFNGRNTNNSSWSCRMMQRSDNEESNDGARRYS